MALRLGSLLNFGLLLIAVHAQVALPPYSQPLSGICRVDVEQINVLPAGFDRSVNSPFTGTHTLNSSKLVSEAATLEGCQFQVFDPIFYDILGSNPSVTRLASTPATECCTDIYAYLPRSNSMVFGDYPLNDPPSTSNIKLANLDTGDVTSVPLESPIGTIQGINTCLGPYDDRLVVSTVGNLFDQHSPAGIASLDPYSGNWTWIVNNYFGQRFNGINGVICLKDGTIIFAGSNVPEYARASKAPGQLPNRVYALSTTGVVRPVIADLWNGIQAYPDGIEVSPDEKVLYVSIRASQLNNATDVATANLIYAYDLVPQAGGEISLQNGRIFAATDVGTPVGFKVDTNGYVYTAAGDGVQVFNPYGGLVGKIIIPPNTPKDQSVYTVAFGGNKLVISHNTELLQIKLNRKGPVNTTLVGV